MATSSAPQLHTWAITTTHPLSGIPIALPWPQRTTLEVAAQIANSILTTYTVTDLVWPVDNAPGHICSVILWTSNDGKPRLCLLPADSVDDAVVRLGTLASSGTLTVLA
jgi:hypothetical protein